jgi:hypothetical protein
VGGGGVACASMYVPCRYSVSAASGALAGTLGYLRQRCWRAAMGQTEDRGGRERAGGGDGVTASAWRAAARRSKRCANAEGVLISLREHQAEAAAIARQHTRNR